MSNLVDTMHGNECILTSPVDKLKQNGNLAASLSSPASRKNEVVGSSPESRPSQQLTPPDAGNNILEENATPDVKSHCKSKYYACPPSGSLKHVHRTPPSRTKSIVVTNPFDVGITDRLPFPMYSPSVFARVVSPSQDSPTFRWTIEDISRIYPADIEEFPAHQFEEAVDPVLESKAQEAINRFFHKNQPNLPSPWNTKPDSSTLRQEINAGTPTLSLQTVSASPGQTPSQRVDSESDQDQSPASQKNPSKEVWTQTTLTLPPILPPSMELALKPFFTFTQDQQQAQQVLEGDEGAMSTSSLRRKLFFQSDSSPSPAPSTPIHPSQFSVTHGSVSHSLVQFQGRSFGTPLPGNNQLQSPPGISPVPTGVTPMRRVKSATRLDFTRDTEDMSIDVSISQNPPSTPRQTHLIAHVGACSPLGTAPLHDKDSPEEIVEHSQIGVKWAKRNKRNSLNCSNDAMSISQTSTPVKTNVSMDASSAHNMMDISQSKPASQTEGWREGETLPDVTYQHEVTNFSYSQHAVSSNMMSQDTGYGTRSSCEPATFQSGTNSMFGLSLTRDKMGYEDSLATWPINPNVVSSTPTKTLGTRISEYQRDTA
ncbi:Protein aurora borealis [Frankliniella fusca]|uniref:Protein aurora borealis n=1 Tax=Frankliniella fusca TaxID=407009 RepID=A0AAE1GT49_9NEOP|nr:Protein aurora borealis [Frankliniella fusca]